MRTVLDIVVIWPMPAVWLAVAGAIFLRRRAGRTLLVFALMLLLVGSLPATGKALMLPLENAAPDYTPSDTGTDGREITAIVVFLAGAFVDPDGRWWPLAGSIRRTVMGRQLHQATKLPIILSGGAPIPGQAPEAEVIVKYLEMPTSQTILESSASDTFESGKAVARLLAERFPGATQPRVILVTARSHIARASAVLRRFGVETIAAPIAAKPRDHRLAKSRIFDFIPSARGLGSVRGAWREYVGITWYLLSGRIRLRDL